MRKKVLLTLLTLLSSAVPSHAFLWWRDSVPCVRAEKPPTIDGSDADWNNFDEYESDGLSLRAMSDATNLYLLVEGRGKDGLAELSGRYRKDLTFRFVSTDNKKRVWGLRLPFSQHDTRGGGERPPGFPSEPPAGGAGVDPTFVEMRGHDEVDGPMPSDIAFAALLTERRSLYEIRVPLNKLPLKGKRTVLLDIDRDAPPADAFPRPIADSVGHNQSGGSDQSRGGMRGGMGGGDMGGGMGGGGMGGGGMPGRGGPSGGPPSSPEIDAINMRLKVILAPGP